eukprot:1754382-Pleurochrysis_carterae.AAC.1
MDDKINDRERDQRTATGQRDAHLLVSVLEAPSQMENSNTTSTPASGRGELAVNGPSGLVTVDDSEPNGSPKPLPTRNGDQKGKYVLVGSELGGSGSGKGQHIKDKDDTGRVLAVSKPSGVDM